jgi:cleavage and polyadenylation specificity factor subunit 1
LWNLRLISLQEDPYKFTTISKDLQKVATVSGDFLVQEGQVSFVTTDRSGDIRMLDFDPAGESCSIVSWHRDRPGVILT